MRIPRGWKNPLTEEHLLLLSFFDDTIRRRTTAIVAKRNSCVAALADSLLIAHAERGGKTEKLCKDALARDKPVFTLDSRDNGHLVELGVAPMRAENLAPLVAGKHIRL